MKTWLWLVSLLFVVMPVVSCAEELPSLTLGGVELKLESPKEEVMAKLSRVYDLRRVKGTEPLNGEHWTVFQKGSKFQAVGGVGFKNGTLDFASHTVVYLTEGSKATDLASALFSLFEGLKSTGTEYTVKTSSKYGPEFRSVLFRSPAGRAVVVGIAKGNAVQTAVTLEEAIGWPEPEF